MSKGKSKSDFFISSLIVKRNNWNLETETESLEKAVPIGARSSRERGPGYSLRIIPFRKHSNKNQTTKVAKNVKHDLTLYQVETDLTQAQCS